MNWPAVPGTSPDALPVARDPDHDAIPDDVGACNPATRAGYLDHDGRPTGEPGWASTTTCPLPTPFGTTGLAQRARRTGSPPQPAAALDEGGRGGIFGGVSQRRRICYSHNMCTEANQQASRTDTSRTDAMPDKSEAFGHATFSSACSLCGSRSARLLFTVPWFDDPDRQCDLVQCSNCKAVRTMPPMSETDLASLYDKNYYGGAERKFAAPLEQVLTGLTHIRAGWLDRQVRRSQRDRPGTELRVLDIGCGRGTLLKGLHRYGWKCWGLERPEFPRTAASDSTLLLDDLNSAFLDNTYFDLVVLWHVLEHLENPQAALARAHALLRPGGLLAVAVPNFGSLQRRVFGRNWFALDIPRHRYHFDRNALGQALGPGFRIRVSHTWSLDQNPYAFVQSVLNALSPASMRNTLYAGLHTGGHGSRQWLPALAQITLAVTVAPFAMVEYLLSGLLGVGATVTILAERMADDPR